MKRRIRQFLALASLAILETIRQPIFLILVTTALLLMGLASLQAYSFGEDGKLARDSAAAVHIVLGMVVGAYSACTMLTREMKNGTASVILSKPVGRGTFFLAKFLGIIGVILLFSACVIPATLLCEKAAPKFYRIDTSAVAILFCAPLVAYGIAAIVNHRTGRPFVSTAFWLLLVCIVAGLAVEALRYDPESAKRLVGGHTLEVRNAIQWRLIPSGILITMALMVVSAIALALATRLDTIPVLSICAAILFLGLLSDYFLQGLDAKSIPAILLSITPNWQYFWLTDSFVAGGTIRPVYVVVAGAYAVFYIVAALGVGAFLFHREEVT
jgi:hypothetical protein